MPAAESVFLKKHDFVFLHQYLVFVIVCAYCSGAHPYIVCCFT